jgi:hypothetical protein
MTYTENITVKDIDEEEGVIFTKEEGESRLFYVADCWKHLIYINDVYEIEYLLHNDKKMILRMTPL